MKRNSRKESFLTKLPDFLIEDIKSKFQDNLNFSFQFFDNSQRAGQDFKEWNQEQLYKLLDKLKQYCTNTPSYWRSQRVGGGTNKILEIYKKFPACSEFEYPKHVPLDVEWARFRLESDMRLIGFIVNKENCKLLTIYPNTFYIVFLDAYHKFYKKSNP